MLHNWHSRTRFSCEVAVIPRALPLQLVAILAVLLVALAVAVAGYAIVSAVEDTPGAVLLWRVVVGLLLLIGTDFVLLVGVLALREIDRNEEL